MGGTHPSISINPNASPAPNPSSCKLKDFFDHSKFIFFFSSIKKIISANWSTLGTAFNSIGISKDKFNVCMTDLNAGRNDADHYDAEDVSYPEQWEIDDMTMSAFSTAYATMEKFFDSCNL